MRSDVALSLTALFSGAALLENCRFILCVASSVIHSHFAALIEPSLLRLVGGGTLPAPRALRQEAAGRWLDYHLEGGR